MSNQGITLCLKQLKAINLMNENRFKIEIETDEFGYTMYQQFQEEIFINTNKIKENNLGIERCEDYLLFAEFFELDKDFIPFTKDRIKFLNVYNSFINIRNDIKFNRVGLYLAKTELEQIIHIRYIFIEIKRYIDRMDKKDSLYINEMCDNYPEFVVMNGKAYYAFLFNDFLEKNYKMIKKNRNLSTHNAEIDNYKNYYKRISNIKIIDVENICAEFINCQEILFKLLESLNVFHSNDLNKIIIDLENERHLEKDELYDILEEKKSKISFNKYKHIKYIISQLFKQEGY